MRTANLLLAFAASLIILAGCDGEDYLNNVTPSSDAGPGQGKWQSVEDLEFLTVGAYWMTSGEVFGDNQQVFGSWARTMPTGIGVPFNDAGGGYYLWQPDAQVFYGRNPNNPDNGALNDIWGSAYSSIHNANEGITYMEENFLNNEGSPPFPDPDNWVPRMYGELKFLRAYNYWVLAKTFAPPFSQDNLSKESVVLRTAPTLGFGEASKAPGTVEELYNASCGLDQCTEAHGQHEEEYLEFEPIGSDRMDRVWQLPLEVRSSRFNLLSVGVLDVFDVGRLFPC